MKIGDGRATVTGYKLPEPLIKSIGKAEARFEARSQDTGLFVLVPILPHRRVNFSAKEKDEASPPDCFPSELEEAFIPALPEFEGFCISGCGADSQHPPVFKLRAGLAAS